MFKAKNRNLHKNIIIAGISLGNSNLNIHKLGGGIV